MRKKSLALLIIVMLIAALSISVFAADNKIAFTVEAPASLVKAGETVTMTVSISESTGFSAASIYVEYDTDALTYISHEFCSNFNSNKCTTPSMSDGLIKLSIQSASPNVDITTTGALVTVTFKVSDTFSDNSGESLVTAYTTPKNVMNGRFESNFDVESGSYVLHTAHYSVDYDTIPATCTTNGYTGGTYCTVCGKVTAARKVLLATGHKNVETRTEPGYTEGKFCKDCQTWISGHISTTLCPHVNVEVLSAKPATCDTYGLTEGKRCKDCGTDILPQEVIKPTGHTLVADPAVEVTCTKDGLTEGAHCSVCYAVIVPQVVIKALGHTEVVDKVVDPTCTTDGVIGTSHCSVCGEVLVATETVVPATGHKFGDWTVAKEAEPGVEGSKERVCSVCGTKETETIPALATTTSATTKQTTSATTSQTTTEPEKPGLSTGATVGIVAASVAVVGGGAVALFLLKKKNLQ